MRRRRSRSSERRVEVPQQQRTSGDGGKAEQQVLRDHSSQHRSRSIRPESSGSNSSRKDGGSLYPNEYESRDSKGRKELPSPHTSSLTSSSSRSDDFRSSKDGKESVREESREYAGSGNSKSSNSNSHQSNSTPSSNSSTSNSSSSNTGSSSNLGTQSKSSSSSSSNSGCSSSSSSKSDYMRISSSCSWDQRRGGIPHSSSSTSQTGDGRERRHNGRQRSNSRSSSRDRRSNVRKCEEGGGMIRLLETAASAAAVAERDAAALREKTLRAAAAAERREQLAAVAGNREKTAAATSGTERRATTAAARERDHEGGVRGALIGDSCRWQLTKGEEYDLSRDPGRGKEYCDNHSKQENRVTASARGVKHYPEKEVKEEDKKQQTLKGTSMIYPYNKRLKKEEDVALSAGIEAAAQVLTSNSNSNSSNSGSSRRDTQAPGLRRGPPQSRRDNNIYAWGQSSSSSSSSSSNRRDTKNDHGKQRRTSHREEDEEISKPPLEPNFEVSGLLQESEQHTTMMRGDVQLKHSAPPDAAMPTKRWRLYMFKREKGAAAEEVACQEPVNLEENTSEDR